MRRGVCVKCGSNLIYVVPVATAGHGNLAQHGPDLYLGQPWVQDSHFLACRSCGYTERYINTDRIHLIERFGRSLAQAQAIAAEDR